MGIQATPSGEESAPPPFLNRGVLKKGGAALGVACIPTPTHPRYSLLGFRVLANLCVASRHNSFATWRFVTRVCALRVAPPLPRRWAFAPPKKLYDAGFALCVWVRLCRGAGRWPLAGAQLARSRQELPGTARDSQEPPGATRGRQEQAGAQAGAARSRQEPPGTARSHQEPPAAARIATRKAARSAEQPGAARTSKSLDSYNCRTFCNHGAAGASILADVLDRWSVRGLGFRVLSFYYVAEERRRSRVQPSCAGGRA